MKSGGNNMRLVQVWWFDAKGVYDVYEFESWSKWARRLMSRRLKSRPDLRYEFRYIERD